MKKKILIVGGHAATTALATIKALKKSKNADWKIAWVGTKKAFEGKKAATLESKIFPKENIDYFEITSGRLQRKLSKYTFSSILRIPKSFKEASELISKVDPDIVLSFGGSASLPVVTSAKIRNIPIVIHEQTSAIGLANKLSAPLASKIAISRNESLKYFPKQKVVLTGNPLLPHILSIKSPTKLDKTPVIFITGGSRGSQTINRVIFQSLEELTTKYKLIHLTGELDYKIANDFRNKLIKENQKNYQIYSSLHPDELKNIFSKAHIAISRAGANTVSELVYLSIPSIFIPIPWTRYDEQTKNALMAEKCGKARVILEDDLNKELLSESIEKVIRDWHKMKNSKCDSAKLDENASGALVDLIEETV